MEDKKQYILEEVGKMYMRHGIRSVTMDDVAAELGVSKKTLYQYFKDKAELVSQVVESFLSKDEQCHCHENDTLNAIDRVFWMREHLNNLLKLVHNNLEYDLKKSYPKLYKKISEYKKERFYEDSFSVIEQGKQEGFFRTEVDSDFVSRLSVGRFLLVFNPDHGLFTQDEVQNISLFDQVTDYHFHGICTEEGLKYYKKQLNKVQNEN
ncbi:TetR/AcrR family transcriptional regulator [Sunxiuqinia indica]|uniref:TetR/AcrR family transcriptional regulator n=1 Tax=Sunxiuqinia indica TaxID=2692584 RepID=UPI001357B3AC|nr:TetR/AcrR family transcriptional regulator [Sunxiuqinia indica]